MRAQVLALAVAALICLTGAAAASAHTGGVSTTRLSAQWDVKDIMWDDYGWYVSYVRCGSSSWIVGIHFPCTFTRLGRRYTVCYHSIDYDYGEVTNYNRYSCGKWY